MSVPTTSYREIGASGIGLATLTPSGVVLDTWFPEPQLGEFHETGTFSIDGPPAADELLALAGPDPERDVVVSVVRTRLASLASPPVDAYDVYLRLHLLSARLITPHEANLTGVFGLLSNVVWTNQGPCSPLDFEKTRLKLRARGPVQVLGVDKFPRMVDYVLPTGVRIADADRVRLGAHLAEGTTIMHEGFVNFNAGTLGASMVEGRISSGVVIGDGSDVGGGASVMGTLSGGGKEVISVGKRALIGANAGIGISLGDDSVVEAGLYITAGTKVTTPEGEVVAARALSGVANLLWRRNSVTGVVEVLPRAGSGITLNPALHGNNP